MGLRSIAVAHSPGRTPVRKRASPTCLARLATSTLALFVRSDQPKQRTAGWMGMRSIAVAHSHCRVPVQTGKLMQMRLS
eukprot:7381592-Pyramimonas_sp.AAC.1